MLTSSGKINLAYRSQPFSEAVGLWSNTQSLSTISTRTPLEERSRSVHGLHLVAIALQSPSSLWLRSVFVFDDCNIFGGSRLVILLFTHSCFVLFSDVSHELLQLFWIWQGHQKWCLVLLIVSLQATGHFEFFSVLESKTSISWWRSVSTVKLFALFCN